MRHNPTSRYAALEQLDTDKTRNCSFGILFVVKRILAHSFWDLYEPTILKSLCAVFCWQVFYHCFFGQWGSASPWIQAIITGMAAQSQWWLWRRHLKKNFYVATGKTADFYFICWVGFYVREATAGCSMVLDILLVKWELHWHYGKEVRQACAFSSRLLNGVYYFLARECVKAFLSLWNQQYLHSWLPKPKTGERKDR